jgi:hypothetical protein
LQPVLHEPVRGQQTRKNPGMRDEPSKRPPHELATERRLPVRPHGVDWRIARQRHGRDVGVEKRHLALDGCGQLRRSDRRHVLHSGVPFPNFAARTLDVEDRAEDVVERDSRATVGNCCTARRAGRRSLQRLRQRAKQPIGCAVERFELPPTRGVDCRPW